MKLVATLLAFAALGVGCKSSAPSGTDNRTFYQNDEMAPKSARAERPYPPLDLKGPPEYIGVAVLDGMVRMSRPTNWTIRRVSLAKDRRFIEYASPHNFLFSVYERLDDSDDDWGDILARYEEDAKASGAEVVGGRVPVAAHNNAQGREFLVKRTVKAQKAPYTNVTHEVVYRSDKHVALIEIVHQGESLEGVTAELMRVMETIEVE